MKVAIISAFTLDTTMPLTKHLAQENVDVNLFGIMPKYNQNVFVVDFSENKQPCGFINSDILIKKMGKSHCDYLLKVKTKLFVFPAGWGKKAFFPDIYYAWKFSQHIIKGKYHVVHLIHATNRFSLLLLHFLRNQNIVQTLHEVTAHQKSDTGFYNIKILNKLIKKNIPIIFHSQTSKDRFISYRASIMSSDLRPNQITIIRFSLHETYLHFAPAQLNTSKKSIDKSIPIILHLGRVVPYKGIDILIDAVKIIQKTQPVHLIVAGGGKSYFSFEGVDSYEFLNYSISNEEIIDLIENCMVVVCPYRSASQSGIPMTVFSFNKPIIASNIGGFSEVIEHNINGILVDRIEAPAFAEAIGNLISDKELRDKMVVNIGNFQKGEFSWSNIAKSTLNFYKMHYPVK